MHSLRVTAAGHSETGKRPHNEDSYRLDLERGVFLVADGMGGLQAGEEASKLAVDLIPGIVADRIAAKDRPDEAVAIALEMASQAVMQKAQTDTKYTGMGTTAVVGFVTPSRVYVGNLGDSPAYLVRGGKASRLTHDHTVTDELVRKGLLTPEQAKTHPWRNRLFKYLGCTEMQELADIHEFAPKPGDRLILVSDGVANYMPEVDYPTILSKHADLKEAAGKFTRLAIERGSNDNVTCLIVAFD